MVHTSTNTAFFWPSCIVYGDKSAALGVNRIPFIVLLCTTLCPGYATEMFLNWCVNKSQYAASCAHRLLRQLNFKKYLADWANIYLFQNFYSRNSSDFIIICQNLNNIQHCHMKKNIQDRLFGIMVIWILLLHLCR